MNYNQKIFDAALRHQINLRRYSTAQVKEILSLLSKSDKDLQRQLEKHLKYLAGLPLDLKSKRLKALQKDIKILRDEAVKLIKQQTTSSLKDLAKVEVAFEEELLRQVLPVEFSVASVSIESLIAATLGSPFAGGANSARSLQQWFEGLRIADQQRIVEAVQLGLIQGSTTPEIIQKVMGTAKNNFRDGILELTRRNAEAVVRTGINHVSNAARGQVWEANSDIVYALKWVATLDGRTSSVCRGRDGALTPIGDNKLPKDAKLLQPSTARPPAHPNCRSVMVSILSAEALSLGLGDRPFVRDNRTGKRREIDFREEAKTNAGSKWAQWDAQERRAAINKLKKKWAEENVGQVPANTTYQDWLKTQDQPFQEKILGKAKAKLFRDGKVNLDEFIDKNGNELTLEELRKQKPDAFV